LFTNSKSPHDDPAAASLDGKAGRAIAEGLNRDGKGVSTVKQVVPISVQSDRDGQRCKRSTVSLPATKQRGRFCRTDSRSRRRH
jgi:hypothetical protein